MEIYSSAPRPTLRIISEDYDEDKRIELKQQGEIYAKIIAVQKTLNEVLAKQIENNQLEKRLNDLETIVLAHTKSVDTMVFALSESLNSVTTALQDNLRYNRQKDSSEIEDAALKENCKCGKSISHALSDRLDQQYAQILSLSTQTLKVSQHLLELQERFEDLAQSLQPTSARSLNSVVKTMSGQTEDPLRELNRSIRRWNIDGKIPPPFSSTRRLALENPVLKIPNF